MERTPAHDPPDVPPDPGQSPASTAEVPPFALATVRIRTGEQPFLQKRSLHLVKVSQKKQ